MAKRTEPRHFYLNEHHELSRGEREGGGRLPKLGDIDWTAKQRRLSSSLSETKRVIDESEDPLKGSRYFLLAKPERAVPKRSDDPKKAPGGRFDEPVDYAGKDAKALGRLGLDVIGMTEVGALVHATPERMERLESIAPKLRELGRGEQARWASLSEFQPIPESTRADKSWLESIGSRGRHEAIIELQPLLSRVESSVVFRTIAENLVSREGESIVGSGSDFSGRSWVRALLSPRSVRLIIQRYFSVQAVHPPLLSPISAAQRKAGSRSVAAKPRTVATDNLPVVGVVDAGVAANHVILEGYRRGSFIHPQSQGVFDDHGAFVTSRVVFGDPPPPVQERPIAECRFLDVVVARDRASVDDKIVANAIDTVAANYPDTRTFNLSFGDYTAVDSHQPVERTQRLLLTQDLDNLIFARDLVVIAAAGNSVQGQIPNPRYPDHWQDPLWRLGHWAVGFNTVKCGSFVRDWTLVGGLADIPYAPSPFCRVGPGLAESPVPDFSAHGGNTDANYRFAAALGVWGLNAAGLWEDRIGTSHAAPLLARECAFSLRLLQRVCPSGSEPFSTTVKALLALTAFQPNLPPRYTEVAARTLGFGEASARRLDTPSNEEAIFVWQGVLADKTDQARILLPIPTAWLEGAGDPTCEIMTAWNTPVNAAFPNVYGCRRIDVKLRPSPEGQAVRPSPGGHNSYPLRLRTYGLKRTYEKGGTVDDLWVIELSYEELCDYPPTQTFTPEQRVSIAVRLKDRSGQLGPQRAVQNHPLAETMTRLSVTPIPAAIPVSIKVT
jgi:hypothetical protein